MTSLGATSEQQQQETIRLQAVARQFALAYYSCLHANDIDKLTEIYADNASLIHCGNSIGGANLREKVLAAPRALGCGRMTSIWSLTAQKLQSDDILVCVLGSQGKRGETDEKGEMFSQTFVLSAVGEGKQVSYVIQNDVCQVGHSSGNRVQKDVATSAANGASDLSEKENVVVEDVNETMEAQAIEEDVQDANLEEVAQNIIADEDQPEATGDVGGDQQAEFKEAQYDSMETHPQLEERAQVTNNDISEELSERAEPEALPQTTDLDNVEPEQAQNVSQTDAAPAPKMSFAQIVGGGRSWAQNLGGANRRATENQAPAPGPEDTNSGVPETTQPATKAKSGSNGRNNRGNRAQKSKSGKRSGNNNASWKVADGGGDDDDDTKDGSWKKSTRKRGHKADSKRGRNRGGGRQDSRLSDKDNAPEGLAKTLYVKLPQGAELSDINKIFAKFGRIRVNQVSSRNFCFVRYDSVEECEAALRETHYFQDELLSVAQRRFMNRKGGSGRGGRGRGMRRPRGRGRGRGRPARAHDNRN